MVDYNIEFAHIYGNGEFNEEHIKSVKIARELIEKLKKENKSFVACILIDEFHAEKILNEEEIVNKAKDYGVYVDFIAYESKLGPIASKIISEVKIKTSSLKNNNGDHSCALLASSWHLARLGKHKLPENAIKKINNKPFEAKKIITILPKKYKPVEEKALNIIKLTKYKNSGKKIKYIFF